MDELDLAKRILSKYPLCSNCLGRLFASLGYGLSNRDRGVAIKTLLLMKAYNVATGSVDVETVLLLTKSGFEPAIKLLRNKKLEGYESLKAEKCYICEDLLESSEFLKAVVGKILDKVKEYEFESFLVGTHVDAEILEREERIVSEFGIPFSESIKKEINRELGKKLQEAIGRDVNYRNPDLTILVHFPQGEFSLDVKPLFIYGRYRKLMRGLSQSAGRLHVKANVKAKPSVEEFIGRPLLKLTEAEMVRLHGAGREDVDVLMLGNGRPFVAEVVKPKKRNIELERVKEMIREYSKGAIEVEDLRFTNRKTIAKLKALSQHTTKLYRAVVTFENEVAESQLNLVEEVFRNKVIKQRTPLRVLRRRADKVRSKIVYEVKARKLSNGKVEFLIKCQGGLYVKELITGDEGRTKPSIAEVLENKPIEIVLDVLYIEEFGEDIVPRGC